MSVPQDNFKNYTSAGYNKKCLIEGLNSFKKSLEKHFFSNVTIRDYSGEGISSKLILELECNFELCEMLHYFKLGTWGNFNCEKFSISKLLQQLNKSNDVPVEIEEFSIFLKDSSIIITKIYEKSIAEQLEYILTEINDNYIHFTKGFTETPYEIYVPVFEESVLEHEGSLNDIACDNNNARDYFKYWGLYFFSEDDAVIYDLKNTAVISGNLHMLNR